MDFQDVTCNTILLSHIEEIEHLYPSVTSNLRLCRFDQFCLVSFERDQWTRFNSPCNSSTSLQAQKQFTFLTLRFQLMPFPVDSRRNMSPLLSVLLCAHSSYLWELTSFILTGRGQAAPQVFISQQQPGSWVKLRSNHLEGGAVGVLPFLWANTDLLRVSEQLSSLEQLEPTGTFHRKTFHQGVKHYFISQTAA